MYDDCGAADLEDVDPGTGLDHGIVVEGLRGPDLAGDLHPAAVSGHGAHHDALVGRQALVIERVSAHGGQIKVGGDIWTARPYDEDLVIEPGATVDIFQIKGATALVHQVPELDP